MIDAAGAIWRTEALRHDALAAKDAGVREDDSAVGVKVFVEGDPVLHAAEEVGQRMLTILQPRPSEVLAVEFDQIESAEHGGVVTKPITEIVEHREAAFVDRDGLAVHNARPHRQASDRIDDLREARREIVAAAGKQPHAVGVSPSDDAKAIVLDFVNPAGPRRWHLGRPRQAGLKRTHRPIGICSEAELTR